MNQVLNYFYLFVDNVDYFGILVLVFLACVFTVLGIVFIFRRGSILEERMDRLLPAAKNNPSSGQVKLLRNEEANGILPKITRPLQGIIAPSQGAMQKKLRLELIRAGYRSEQAMRNYLAAKVLLFLLLPFTYIMVVGFVYTFTPQVALISLVLALVGFFIPNIILYYITQARKASITRALPDALDLMVVCVEAGLGLDMTFKKTGEEIRAINQNLSDEFYLTNLEVRAGISRQEAFKNMSLRTGVPEVHNLMTVLLQTSRFGTSVAQALRIHADAMRVKRRQIAEEKAAKSAVKLIFPLILFIFPALLIVLAGPAAIRVVQTIFPVFGG